MPPTNVRTSLQPRAKKQFDWDDPDWPGGRATGQDQYFILVSRKNGFPYQDWQGEITPCKSVPTLGSMYIVASASDRRSILTEFPSQPVHGIPMGWDLVHRAGNALNASANKLFLMNLVREVDIAQYGEVPDSFRNDGLTQPGGLLPGDSRADQTAGQQFSSELVCQDQTVNEFAQGLDGEHPSEAVVNTAERIVKAARERVSRPDISVDVDGALSFDMRVANGWLLMAELDVDGNIDASVYDDKAGKRVRRLRRGTEQDLIDLFF